MKMNKLAALLAASTMVAASTAMADDHASAFTTSASVALSTDYMWRGASQTDSEPAISGSFDLGHASGLYAGAWASNIDYMIGTDQAHIELNYYAGFANDIGDTGISYDVGALRYVFPGTDGADWNEAYIGLSYSMFSLKVSHSGDALASSESGTHYLLGFNHDLPMDIGFHANYAFYDLDDDINDDTLEDYNLGITKNLAGFDFDLTYYKTLSDAEDFVGNDSLTDDRVVLTVSKSL